MIFFQHTLHLESDMSTEKQQSYRRLVSHYLTLNTSAPMVALQPYAVKVTKSHSIIPQTSNRRSLKQQVCEEFQLENLSLFSLHTTPVLHSVPATNVYECAVEWREDGML